MSLILPSPPERYAQSAERARNQALIAADTQNFKRGSHLDLVSEKITLLDENGAKWEIVVRAGVLSARPFGTPDP